MSTRIIQACMYTKSKYNNIGGSSQYTFVNVKNSPYQSTQNRKSLTNKTLVRPLAKLVNKKEQHEPSIEG